MYIVYYLKEVPRKQEPTVAELELMNKNSTVDENTKNEPDVSVGKMKWSEVFNSEILRDSLNVVFRKRDYNARTVILLLFLVTLLYSGVFAGDGPPPKKRLSICLFLIFSQEKCRMLISLFERDLTGKQWKKLHIPHSLV